MERKLMPDSRDDIPKPASPIHQDDLEIDLRVLAGQFWQRRRLLAAGAAVGLLIGGGARAIAGPPYMATVRLVIDARGTAPDLAGYRGLVEGPVVVNQVVKELTVAGAEAEAEAVRSLSIQATAEPPATIVATAIMSDPELAARAADSLARHAVDLARKRNQVEAVRSLLAAASALHTGVSQLRREIEAEEAGLQVLEASVKTTSPRNPDLERDAVLSRVRLKQLAVKRDRLLQLVALAADLGQKLDDSRLEDGVPATVKAGIAELDRLGGATPSASIDDLRGTLRSLGPSKLESRNDRARIVSGAAVGLVAGLSLLALGTFLSAVRAPLR